MEIIDLTHLMENDMPAYPGEESPSFVKHYHYDKDGVQVLKFTSLTHSGTHIDLPAHFFIDGTTTDKMPACHYFGKGIVMECDGFGKNEEITLSHMKKYAGKLADARFALIYTGWDRLWGEAGYFDHFPVLTQDAAEFLTHFPLYGIGIDVASIDAIDSTKYPNHLAVLGRGLVIVENLKDLHLLRGKDFSFAAFPLKIKDGDGSPVRAVAIIDR